MSVALYRSPDRLSLGVGLQYVRGLLDEVMVIDEGVGSIPALWHLVVHLAVWSRVDGIDHVTISVLRHIRRIGCQYC